MTDASRPRSSRYDAVVIGSGFGGAMAARTLVEAGLRVAMIERGGWVRRGPENWHQTAIFHRSPYYRKEPKYRVEGHDRGTIGSFHCVGGPSVFFGAVAMRFRVEDFRFFPLIHQDKGAKWPIRYEDLEPFYAEAEAILKVAGEDGVDPTEPPRSTSFPREVPPLTQTSQRLWEAAERLGMHPFRLPLAIDFLGDSARTPCVMCATCAGHACAIGAKNDVASAIISPLVKAGLDLRVDRMAVKLQHNRGAVRLVECMSVETGEREVLSAEVFLLAAGALGSPHLVLASGLRASNPAPHAVGRFLMRHSNIVVLGLFPSGLPGSAGTDSPHGEFRKQIGINDFYFGDERHTIPGVKLGNIQQVHGAPIGIVGQYLPGPAKGLVRWLGHRLTGFIAIAEDQPSKENGVFLNRKRSDRFGLPEMVIDHRYSRRDLRARTILARRAKQILKGAGAKVTVTDSVRTFSHAVGTLRMGQDPSESPLAENCRFRGTDNLFVVDGSVFPTSGGVNPSLTIAANALRVSRGLVD